EGVPIVVFNPLGWVRADIAEFEAGFAESGVSGLSLFDADGKAVPLQVLEQERYGDGGYRRAKIAFVARDVPALGYAGFRLKTEQGKGPLDAKPPIPGMQVGTPAYQDDGSIENEYYRATFHLWNAGMTSLKVKSNGWEALSGEANVIAREQDGGDFWELNG